MKHILCVVDLTGSSARVLDVAARIATACNAYLAVLYPYRLISNDHRGDLSSLRRNIESTALEKFKRLEESLPELAKTNHEFHPEIGFTSDRINANAGNVDMIVISQEQADASADIRHANLQHMIRSLRLPFMIVPTEDQATQA